MNALNGITIIESHAMPVGHIAARSDGRVIWIGLLADIPDDIRPNILVVSPADYESFRGISPTPQNQKGE